VIAPGEWYFTYDSDGDGVNDTALKPEDAETASDTASPGVTVFVTDRHECLTGDVNGDGDITLADAVTVLQILTGAETADTPARCADTDGDGKIGFAELLVILRQLAM